MQVQLCNLLICFERKRGNHYELQNRKFWVEMRKKIIFTMAVVKHWNKNQEGFRSLCPWRYSKLQPTLTLKFDVLWTECGLETSRDPSWIKLFCFSLIWCYHVYKLWMYFLVSTDTHWTEQLSFEDYLGICCWVITHNVGIQCIPAS